MKRKLLSLTAALLCAVGMWADTVDCTGKMSNDPSDWTGVGEQTPVQACKTTGVETYQGNTTSFSTGDVLYQTITELSNGYYLVSFYAWENYANHAETDAIAYGDNIAQVFANTSVQDINVIKNTGGRDWDAANTYTLIAQVTNGTLKYGVKNIASGGNWAACKAKSLTYLGTSITADFTSLITNPSFETGDFTGWTAFGCNETDVPVPTAKLVSEKPLTNASGDYVCNYQWWCWSNNPSIPNGISQNIGSLPAGKYRISAVLGAPNGWTVKLYANDESASSTMTSDYAGANLSVNDITLDGSSNLTIKAIVAASTSAWEEVNMRADDFRVFSLDHYYDALNAAIAAAEENTLGFNTGEYAPYNNVAAITALNAAKAVNQANYDISWADLETIVSNLTSATWTVNATDVDAIYNGLFATVAEGQNYPDGWTRTNAWGQMQSGLSGDYATAYYNQPGSLQYGNQGIYTMPLAASQAYKLTFSYRSHENNSNNSMTASVLNGEDGLQATTFAGNGSTSEWVEATAFFTTGAAGNYVLTLGNSGNTWVTNVSLVKVTSATLELSDADGYTPTDRTYYETVELTRTIKADTWSTFCVPFNMENSELDASAEVKELTDATLNGDNYTLTFSDASSIVAGKPYMVRVPSKIESISVSGKTISSTITSTTEGDVTFTGVYTNDDAPMGSFIISDNAFYLVNSKVTLKAFRGYITVESSSSVKALNYVFDDDADGISTIENGQLTIDNAPIYNLAGQRIQKMQKGINIVNGHKVLY